MTIHEARGVYARLAMRCLGIASRGAETEYVVALWTAWDKTLGVLGDDTPLDSVGAEYLTRAVAGDLDHDTLLAWLDAYPDGIAARVGELRASA